MKSDYTEVVVRGIDHIYSISEFLMCVNDKLLIDYDGFGYPVRENKADKTILIKPSTTYDIPDDATHIVWYNR